MQKLPKLPELKINQELPRQFREKNLVPLWSQGKRQIPLLEINDNVLKELAFARRCGSLRVGLEQIKTILQVEETGLVSMKKFELEKKLETRDSVGLPSSKNKIRFALNPCARRGERSVQKHEASQTQRNNDSVLQHDNSLQELNGGRITRLIIVSNDGSERFYRHLESILNRYSHRLLGLKLNVSASVLGHVFYGKEDKAVKALLVNRKDAMLRILSSFL